MLITKLNLIEFERLWSQGFYKGLRYGQALCKFFSTSEIDPDFNFVSTAKYQEIQTWLLIKINS